MNNSSEPRPPLAEGIEWTARITAVAAEMVLPGLAGHWLDRRLGTHFFVFLGFAVGLVGGVWHLLLLTGSIKMRAKKGRGERDGGA